MDPSADPRLAAELLALELALARRDLSALPAGLDGTLEADFLEFGQSGRRWDRSSTIEMLAASAPGPPDLTIADFALDALAADVVLVTYRLTGTGRDGTRRASLRSSIWTRSATGWRLRFHQGTTTEP